MILDYDAWDMEMFPQARLWVSLLVKGVYSLERIQRFCFLGSQHDRIPQQVDPRYLSVSEQT